MGWSIREEHKRYIAVQGLGGGGDVTFFPVLGGNGTKIAPTGDIFDQPAGQCEEFGANLPTM